MGLAEIVFSSSENWPELLLGPKGNQGVRVASVLLLQ